MNSSKSSHAVVPERITIPGCILLTIFLWVSTSELAFAKSKPNILWIITEDHSPLLGAYGDAYAQTPALDALAKEGVLYTNAYSNAPVCSPARSTLITGMYANSMGSSHMPSLMRRPANIKFVNDYLHQAGYYTAIVGKYDFNFMPGDEKWDEIGNNIMSTGWSRSEYLRQTKGEKPFFTFLNLFQSHESRAFDNNFKPLTASEKRTPHDPAQVSVPPYHPDTPIMRQAWARNYDTVSRVDKLIGDIFDDLRKDGLLENTIVFVFSDHGTGMPRGKRWLYDSGLRIPLIVYLPERYAELAPVNPGEQVDDLVAFVDLAPTTLSVAGVEIPSHMQGRAFLGKQFEAPAPYVYGYRDRMDGRYDLIRAATDGHYKYIRNYMPYLSYSQQIAYVNQQSSMREWQRLHDTDELNPVQDAFFGIKPQEELYDVSEDPNEVNNLASDPRYADRIAAMRENLESWMFEIRDTGFLPEAEMYERVGAGTPYEISRESGQYALEEAMEAAKLASQLPVNTAKLLELLENDRSEVRYWGIIGMNSAGQLSKKIISRLQKILEDPSMSVRIAAAQLLCSQGPCEAALAVLTKALRHDVGVVQLQAANAIDYLDEKALPAINKMIKTRDDSDIEPYYLIVARGALHETSPAALTQALYAPIVKKVLDKALSDLDRAQKSTQ